MAALFCDTVFQAYNAIHVNYTQISVDVVASRLLIVSCPHVGRQ